MICCARTSDSFALKYSSVSARLESHRERLNQLAESHSHLDLEAYKDEASKVLLISWPLLCLSLITSLMGPGKQSVQSPGVTALHLKQKPSVTMVTSIHLLSAVSGLLFCLLHDCSPHLRFVTVHRSSLSSALSLSALAPREWLVVSTPQFMT